MITVRWALGAIVAATAVSASADELQLFARLLKRQEPGTPAYNCHDNCGQAIIQGRSSADVCNDEIFLSDYQACLQCSGPDNEDIWKYYGGTLSTSAASCGLSTTPLSGEQPDVGPATPAGSAVTSTSEATSEATSSVATSTIEVSTTTEALTTTVPTTTAAETSTPVATESGTGYATESISVTSASSTGSITYAPTATGSGTGSGNGTATTSSGIVVVTNAANVVSGSSVGFYGALALGALYAAAQ
ncbi:hypothetical protein F4820DRAFT_409854 [Hypoxylon rubiginosum]|uniref:Uncharacterized protein n=1 Tax=Hypoxylon rubiginosum TaxID=110542 RepID=A0ACB9ZA37_9PEZI|nr:hypothetical protein F4820DRAFT_409854 [Hypoxylon rubiginosum]